LYRIYGWSFYGGLGWARVASNGINNQTRGENGATTAERVYREIVSSYRPNGSVSSVLVANIAVQGPRRLCFGADKFGIEPKQDPSRSTTAGGQSGNGKSVGSFTQSSLVDDRTIGQWSPTGGRCFDQWSKSGGRRFHEGIAGKNLRLGQTKTFRQAHHKEHNERFDHCRDGSFFDTLLFRKASIYEVK
jgi:hypothetical protein